VRWVPRVLVALLLLAVTAVELQQARPRAEYHQLVPDIIYDDPGPVMERLGRERGRYVSIAWDRPNNAAERDLIEVPEGWPSRMVNYYRISWPRRLAARPAWEYATNAETISGRDGGLMPLRTYQEFFAAAVNAKGHLTAGVNLQPPSEWGWDALDLMGVRWFVTASLPPAEGDRRPGPAGGPAPGRLPAGGAGHRRAAPGCPGPPDQPPGRGVTQKRPDPGRGRGPERRRGAVGAG
ncbi:MAG: hypothetical protein K0S88_4726, partial [Actinomycetia bacterium]|nr:hypothetical protein [Actinomycetes bacterium]